MKKTAILLFTGVLCLCIVMLGACSIKKEISDTVTDSVLSEHTEDNKVKDTQSEETDMNIEKPKYLTNTLYKIQIEKELKVGYFGGSVTAGAGATNRESDSWRALTRDWLKTTFKSANITEVNASYGGTGSVFGVYRIDEQYIGEKAPDLNFVELAINDTIDFLNGKRVSETNENYVYIETIVRKIYASNPDADIIFVLTGNYGWLKNEIEEGEIFGKKYIDIGDYYDIPVIRVGTVMAEILKQENGGTYPAMVDNKYPELWYGPFAISQDKNKNFIVTDGDCIYTIDRIHGIVSSIVSNGKEMLSAPIIPNIWRAPVDNDMYVKRDWIAAGYDRMQLRCEKCKIVQATTEIIEISAILTLSAVAKSPTLYKVAKLLQYFIVRGGHQLQLNAVNLEAMKDAQKHPENYRQLVVRIWGWSAYFVELDKEFQDHVMARQEYSV